MQTYRDLNDWQVNQQCIELCAKLMEKLPRSQPAGIISDQLFRSIASVGANIAEGYGSYEGWEYPRYCRIALRSATESDHWLATLRRLFPALLGEIDEIETFNCESIKMLKGLIKSIVAKRTGLHPTP